MKLYNSLTNQEEDFVPDNPEKVTMYVCGPTVYDSPHIGNARSAVIFDLLFRVLNKKFNNKVCYVRNITDIDDKIIKAAIDTKAPINYITNKFTKIYEEALAYLNCLEPTHTPKATEHLKEMEDIINKLISHNKAYVKNGHVYFRVLSDETYGSLAGRKLEELVAGSRVEIDENKEHPGDFVLWKPANNNDPKDAIFVSEFGPGRPGWHIECSAMSHKFLGENFDIHGGGADLMFPHHTNEIAQSCGAHPGSKYAKFWVHNGFVTVEGKKMSKSLNNFITVTELQEQNLPGEIIRFILLNTHYKKPLDWNQDLIKQAFSTLEYFYNVIKLCLDKLNLTYMEFISLVKIYDLEDQDLEDNLYHDLNTAKFYSLLHEMAKKINLEPNIDLLKKFVKMANIAGFLEQDPLIFLKKIEIYKSKNLSISIDEINNLIKQRQEAKDKKDFAKADEIRNYLIQHNIKIKDNPNNQTSWEIN